jgi:hypothetical protein
MGYQAVIQDRCREGHRTSIGTVKERGAAMGQQATNVSVRKSVVVEVAQEHAFDVFTSGFDSWWTRDHQAVQDATITP